MPLQQHPESASSAGVLTLMPLPVVQASHPESG